MNKSNAVVLFGHGARDPEWARPMQRTREHLQALAPDMAVELAFLEFLQPALVDAIDGLVAQAVRHITVVPMFIAQGGHLKGDVPVLVAAARARHPQCAIALAPAVGEAEGVIAAMAAYARSCATGSAGGS